MVSLLVSTVLLLTVLSSVNGQRACLVDIGFVVDDSGSIRDSNPRGIVLGSSDDNWQKQIDFIHIIISGNGTDEGLNIGPNQTRVGLVTFSDIGELYFDFNEHTNKNDLLDQVDRLPYNGGRTNTTGGLIAAKDMLFSPEGGNRAYASSLLVLLTDGRPTRWVDELVPYAAQLRDEHDIRIIGVGVTNSIDEVKLKEIVSIPSENNYFYVDDFGLLQTIVSNLTEGVCPNQAQPTTTPPQTTTAPPQPTTAPLPAECLADIGFVVDESASIRESNIRGTVDGSPDDNWQKQIDFIHTIISGNGTDEGLNIGPNKTRVGLVTFSDIGELYFDFNEHTNKNDLLEQVDRLPYQGGRTNTTGGLMVAKEMLFSPEGGNRANASNLLVLLTDGKPTRLVDILVPYAARLRDEHDIRIISVGVTNSIDEVKLKEIVSTPSENNYFYVDDFSLLQTIVSNLREGVCPNQAQPITAPPQTTTAPPQLTTAPLPARPTKPKGH